MNIFQRGNLLPLFLVLAAAVLVLFPNLMWLPQGSNNLDSSWVWSLNYAAAHHLQWGVDYIFTYGPLGYLNIPCYYGSYSLWLTASLFIIVSRILILVTLLRSCWKSGDRTWSVALVGELIFCVVLVSVSGSEPQRALLLSAYALVCLALVEKSSLTVSIWIALLLAVAGMIKFTSIIAGIPLVVAGLIAALLLRDRERFHHALALAAGYPFFSLIMWTACGQKVSHLPAYVLGNLEVVSGHAIMATPGYTFQIVFALLLLGLYLAATGLGWMRHRVFLALLLVTGPVFFLYWKEGFTRHDLSIWSGHAQEFFSVALFIFWLHYLVAKRYSPLPRDLFLGGAMAGLFFLCICNPTGIPAWQPVNTGTNLQNFVEVACFDDFGTAQEKISADLRTSYNYSPDITKAFRPTPTLVMPSDLVLDPANHLEPLVPPVPQAYLVYTPYLDRANSAWLEKIQPQQVLLGYSAIDSRYPLFDGPEFSYRVLREYSVVAQSDACVVMLRNSAGEPQIKWQGSPQTVKFDQEIILPPTAPHTHLLMKVGIKPSFLGKLYAFVFKTTPPNIIFRLQDGSVRSFLFVFATGEDGLLVSHYVENLKDYVRLNQQTLLANVHSIAFSVEHPWQLAGTFPVEFGTSDVPENAAPQNLVFNGEFDDSSWSLQSNVHPEVLSHAKVGAPLPVMVTPKGGGQLDLLAAGTGTARDQVRLVGWAGLADTGEKCSTLLIVAGTKVVKVAEVDQPRPDVGAYFHFPQLNLCGFDCSFPASFLTGQSPPLRIFSYIRGPTPAQDRLVELNYGDRGKSIVVGNRTVFVDEKGVSFK